VRPTQLQLKEPPNKGQTQKGEEEKKKNLNKKLKPVGTITEGEEGRVFPGK